MVSTCPICESNGIYRYKINRWGFYFRTSDRQKIQRYRCKSCKTTMSPSTFSQWRGQKKRYINKVVQGLLSRGMSINNAAGFLKVNRKTVARKLEALGFYAASELGRINRDEHEKCRVIEFDDLETFEHTKCKPIAVTIAVDGPTRRILGVEVSPMPAKGPLAHKSRELYGEREDGRSQARKRLFATLKDLVHEDAVIKSDSHPHYPPDVKRYFPKARHVTYISRKGSLSGQGELKKAKFDPIFSLNHSCAMLRYNLARLVRKTWCTTKRIDRLWLHVMLYALRHNERIEQRLRKQTSKA
jgi:transposase-like protein